MADDIVTRDVIDPWQEICDLRDEIERLRAAVERMPCGCLPHAAPNDGMCNRCMTLNEEARRG